MKKNIAIIILAGSLALAGVTGCSATNSADTDKVASVTASDSAKTAVLNTDYTGAKTIKLSGSKDQKITEGGKYILTGSLKDAKVIIDTAQEVYIELSGVTINNSKGPALQSDNSKKLTVTIKEGTKNELTDGGSAQINSAVFSNDTIVFEGSGELKINGKNEHGVESDDDIIINGGNIIINAVNDALHANANVTVNGGKVIVQSATEGIESKAAMVVNDGELELNCSDDAINAAENITINGGQIYANSSKGDAIDSNGTIKITGGTVVAIGADMPETAIDCDNNGFTITGGTVVGAAGSSSKPTEETSTQASVILAGTEADTFINIKDSDGQILTFKADKAYKTLLFSSPKLAKGKTCIVSTGGNASGGTQFHNLYTGSTYSAGTQRETVALSAMVTVQGGNAGMGGPGGKMGGKTGERPSGERPKLPDGTQPPSPDGAPPSGEAPEEA